MGSVFRITKAEFIKTFKRPTIYIMAFILLIAAVVSAFVFDPTNRTEDRIKYSTASTPANVYQEFNSSSSTGKTSFDSIVNNANSKIDFYQKMNDRKKAINDAFNNMISAFYKLESEDITIEEYKNAVSEFKASIQNDYEIELEAITTSYNLKYYSDLIDEIDEYIDNCNNPTSVVTGFNNVGNDGLTQYDRLCIIRDKSINIAEESLSYYVKTAKKSFDDLYKMNQNDEITNTTSSKNLQNEKLNGIETNVEGYISYINNLLRANNNLVLITKTNYSELEYIQSYVVNNLIKGSKENNWDVRRSSISQLCSNTFINSLAQISESIQVKMLSDNILESLNRAKQNIALDLSHINDKINELNKPETKLETIQHSVSDYSIMANNYSQYVSDTILLENTLDMKLEDISQLHGTEYEKYNLYQIKERQSVNLYKINNNISGQDSLNSLSFNVCSGYEKNGYDYMFFALSIMTVLIIVFAIMMAVISIGSEQDSGTIKLLLVRPFRRTQVILAKLLSVFYFILVFAIFAFVIALIAGWAVYGLPNISILAIFNATTVLNIHPLLLLFMYLLTIIFEITFYTAFAIAISIIVKNFAASLVTSLIVYLGGITCNILLAGKLAFKWIPFTNCYLFRYFGGAFAEQSSQLTNVFVSPISSNMGFLWSILYCLGIIIILNITSLIIFKKRDF